MFAGVTELEIVGQRGKDHEENCFGWNTVPDTFCQAFLHYLQVHSQDLEVITIYCITSFEISLLNNCGNARVKFEHCKEINHEEKSTNAEDVPLLNPVPFKQFAFVGCKKLFLENLAPWIKMHGLRSLEYRNYSFDTEDCDNQLPPLIVACSNSLTDLYIRTPNGMSSVANFFRKKPDACQPFYQVRLLTYCAVTLNFIMMEISFPFHSRWLVCAGLHTFQ